MEDTYVEDEQMRLAMQMSLSEGPKPPENSSASLPSLGAAAFLERQRSRLSPAPPLPSQHNIKISRASEAQTTPQSAKQEIQDDDAPSALPSPSKRKVRMEPAAPVSPPKRSHVIAEIDLDEEEKKEVEVKPVKMELTDDQLAVIMSRMSEEQIEAYFSGRFSDSAIRVLLEEEGQARSHNLAPVVVQPRSAPPSPPKPVEAAHVASSTSIPLPLVASGGCNSPYTSPQRFFRLNWVTTIEQPAQPRRLSTDPMPEFLRLRDLICKDAQAVYLTTFKVDMVWLLSTVPALLRVPSVVYHGEERDVYAGENFPGPETSQMKLWTYIRSLQRDRGQGGPSQPPFRAEYIHVAPTNHFAFHGCPHGKVIVVKYPGFLRIAISTANLYATDYERKTQGIWFQDFPLKTSESTKLENPLDATAAAKARTMARDFELTIKDYFQRLVKGFDTTFFEAYNYSNVRVALITSVGANMALEMSRSYGHTKLAHVLTKELMPPPGTKSDATCTIYAQMSSVGSISGTYFESLRASFCSSQRQAVASPPIEPMILVWPSSEFVRNSVDGWEAGTSLCAGAKKLIKSKVVLKSLMRYEPPQPDRLLITPHIKSYWRQYSDGSLGWMCLTSANFSKSAWGEIQKGSRLNITNYEAGVLFIPSSLSIPASFGPDPDLPEPKQVKLVSAPSLNIEHSQDGFLTISLPIPFNPKADKYPLQQEPIQSMDLANQPWIWDIPRSAPDSRDQTFRGISD